MNDTAKRILSRRSGVGFSTMSHVAPVSGSDTNVKVVVRVRPENEREYTADTRLVAKCLDDHVIVFDPKEEDDDFYFHGRKQFLRDLRKKENKDVRFMFDQVFDSSSTNQFVYEHTTCGLLEGLLNGYNCSVFAYGATGAGKTFTMLGNSTAPGIVYLTVKDLFRRMDEIKKEKTCEVAVSYLEVYNENIKDLLNPTSGILYIREDPKRGVTVSLLTLHKPKDADELLELLDKGNKNRTQHPTDANEESSRSHAVFTIYIRQRDRLGDINENVRVAKMCLVDLAGSERATMISKNKAARMREGANINKSLLALGSCINALADSKIKAQHVPYRNSKLTHLLKDSLGGNCRTVMIAAISPSSLSYDDSYNTLRYADRAKNIKVTLKKNVMNVDIHVMKYAKVVEDLHQEIANLRAQIKLMEEKETTARPVALQTVTHCGTPNRSEIDRLKKRIATVFSEQRKLRREWLDLESQERTIDVRIRCRKILNERLSLIAFDTAKLDMSAIKADSTIHALQEKKKRLVAKKEKLSLRMKENSECLERVESECKMIDPDGSAPELLAEINSRNKVEVELVDARVQVKHVKKVTRIYTKEMEKTGKLLQNLLPFTKDLYLTLKGHNFATIDLQQRFSDVLKQVQGNNVNWADENESSSANAEENPLDVSYLLDLPIDDSVDFTPSHKSVKVLREQPDSSTPSELNNTRVTKNVSRELVQLNTTVTTESSPPPSQIKSRLNFDKTGDDEDDANISGVDFISDLSPMNATFVKPENVTFTSAEEALPEKPELDCSPSKLRRQTFDTASLQQKVSSTPKLANLTETKENLVNSIKKAEKISAFRVPLKPMVQAGNVTKPLGELLVKGATQGIDDLKRLGLPQVYEALSSKEGNTSFKVPSHRTMARKLTRHQSFNDVRSHTVAAMSKMKLKERSNPYTDSSIRTKSRQLPVQEKSISKTSKFVSRTRKFLTPSTSTTGKKETFKR